VEHPLEIIDEATELELGAYSLKTSLQEVPEAERTLDRAKGVSRLTLN
jgi:hypothetical protein